MLKTPTRLMHLAASALLTTLAACSHVGANKNPAPQTNPSPQTNPVPQAKDTRAQLAIGYSLLYQEADGIPKLKWLLMFKDKPEDMGRVTDELVTYYQHLADTLQRLSKQYPAVRLDVTTMSTIESDMRKALGVDKAKDFAPVVGKSGLEFEREALLLFYDALDEQRHLVGVMLGLEGDPGLKQFLETTKSQLDEQHAKIGALLNRRYFTH